MTLGDSIKQARKGKGFTQKELADMVDVSQVYISEIEKGAKVPSADTRNALEKVLHVNLPPITAIGTQVNHAPNEAAQNAIMDGLARMMELAIKSQELANRTLENANKVLERDLNSFKGKAR